MRSESEESADADFAKRVVPPIDISDMFAPDVKSRASEDDAEYSVVNESDGRSEFSTIDPGEADGGDRDGQLTQGSPGNGAGALTGIGWLSQVTRRLSSSVLRDPLEENKQA